MSTTALDLITRSLRVLGAVAQGETLGSEEATDGLTALNTLIDSLSLENLLIHTKTEETFTLTANDGTYTMGTGADFDTARPLEILHAAIRDSRTTPALDIPMRILTVDEWAPILTKSITSTYPRYLYPTGSYPTETLNLWPVPSEALTLVLWSWKALSELATLQTALSLPPGYERMLVYNLAVDLAPEYGRPVSPEIALIASDSKAKIKAKNSKPVFLRVDSGITGERKVFNWRTGEMV
ncbi:MAG TPA: hypothetical protein VL588_11305 [Bdellovibrionota bacterium]|nr:hypothetical protein [Bdellovibrionota bacterium]